MVPWGHAFSAQRWRMILEYETFYLFPPTNHEINYRLIIVFYIYIYIFQSFDEIDQSCRIAAAAAKTAPSGPLNEMSLPRVHSNDKTIYCISKTSWVFVEESFVVSQIQLMRSREVVIYFIFAEDLLGKRNSKWNQRVISTPAKHGSQPRRW